MRCKNTEKKWNTRLFSSDECQTLEELSEEGKVATIISEMRSEPKGCFKFYPT